jgi:Cu/Ag efflux pump CusA
VRLGKVADVRVRATPAVIQREASQRRMDVSANISGRSAGDVRKDVRDRIRNTQFPLEYHAEAIGAAAGDEATVSHALIFGLVALVGIFLLLQAAFRSWRLATMAFLTLPVALVGGMAASLIDGTSFQLGAVIGLFAVFAIAARNVVALIDHYQRLEQVEGRVHGPDLIVEGAGDRYLPILTTAVATGMALIPFLFLGSRAGLEVVHPMALVVLGGLITSTVLSLFVVPALYLSFGGGPQPELTPEDELMHRWAGVTPEAAAAPAGANGDPLPAEPRSPVEAAPAGEGVMPQGDGAPQGVQPKGEE